MTANPELGEIIQDIFPAGVRSTAQTILCSPRDYRTAELAVKSQEITEAVVNTFAEEKKLAEVLVSIAQLSGLSVDEIERLFMNTWTSPVAVILKGIGFRLSTIDTIYRSRLASDNIDRNDLIQIKAEFIAIRRPTAERILRFFYAKRAVQISGLSDGSSLRHHCS
jgi:hypothetical protein